MSEKFEGYPVGKWAIQLLVGALALTAAVPIYSRPDHEVLYNPWVVDTGCFTEGNCLRIYILEIGNTGWKKQDDVRVEVRDRWLDGAILQPKAAMFGKIPRAMDNESVDGTTTWGLGSLEAGKRIEVRFTLSAESSQALPTWDDILLRVTPTSGEAHEGHPEMTTFTRFIAAVLG